MKVELFYFDSCPSYLKALENARQALRLEGLAEDVDLVNVLSEQDAQDKRLIGSPTIRIDGVDVEGPEADERGYAYGCRVYSDNGHMAGWPAVETIRTALRDERQSTSEAENAGVPQHGGRKESPCCG